MYLFIYLFICIVNIYLLLFSRSVLSDSLRPHELQHTRCVLHCLLEFAQFGCSVILMLTWRPRFQMPTETFQRVPTIPATLGVGFLILWGRILCCPSKSQLDHYCQVFIFLNSEVCFFFSWTACPKPEAWRECAFLVCFS